MTKQPHFRSQNLAEKTQVNSDISSSFYIKKRGGKLMKHSIIGKMGLQKSWCQLKNYV